MRLMNWNIEHMNSWWEPGDSDPAVMRQNFGGNNFSPSVSDVPALAARVGSVINAVDPDLMTIQEGAGVPEMNDFFDRFVNGDWQLLRGAGGGQALVVAARQGGAVSALSPGPQTIGTVDLNVPFRADVNADLVIEDNDFARTPQIVEFTAHNQSFLLLNNHLKSKFVRNGEADFNAGGDRRLGFFREALEARRRISGEAFRIRGFLDEALNADGLARIIVAGDLNDGEGVDFFEQNFLTHSVVDRVFGSIFRTDRRLTHVLFDGGSTDFTAQFFDFISGEARNLVLDHIGLSPGITAGFRWQGRVAVAEYEAQLVDDPSLKERDRTPSDHRPVVAEVTPI